VEEGELDDLAEPPAMTQDEPEEKPKAAPAGYVAKVRPSPEINVMPASNISLDTLGIYDTKSGGLAFDIWQGSDHARVRALLQHMPETIPSPTIRNLVARLLLSSTKPPLSENIQQNIFRQRVETLMHMNEVPQAQRLVELVPQNLRNEAITHLQFTTHLLDGDSDWACSNIGSALQKYNGEAGYWQKVSIFCNALAKETAKVQLGLDLMGEQQVKVDAGFVALAEHMAGRTDTLATRFSMPLSLDDATFVAISGKNAFPEDYLQMAPLPIAKLVSKNTAFEDDVRKMAAKRLANAIAAENPDKDHMRIRGWFADAFTKSTDKTVNFDRLINEAQEIGGKSEQAQKIRRTYRLYALLQALGYEDIAVAEPWTHPTFKDPARIVVSPVLRGEMAIAVNSELAGEAILLLAIAAGQVDNLADADNASISDMIDALVQLGFEKEAQSLAAEAMVSLY
jgi:hypothetical protein